MPRSTKQGRDDRAASSVIKTSGKKTRWSSKRAFERVLGFKNHDALTPFETRVLLYALKRGLKPDLPSRLKKLGEEYGELAEAIANYCRGCPATAEQRLDEIKKEAADINIVLTHIGILCKFSLQQAAIDKLAEVERRHHFQPMNIPGVFMCKVCGYDTPNPSAHKNEQCPEAK